MAAEVERHDDGWWVAARCPGPGCGSIEESVSFKDAKTPARAIAVVLERHLEHHRDWALEQERAGRQYQVDAAEDMLRGYRARRDQVKAEAAALRKAGQHTDADLDRWLKQQDEDVALAEHRLRLARESLDA